MATYDIELAAEILDELVDRVEAGEIVGIMRNGKLVARLVPVVALAAHTPGRE